MLDKDASPHDLIAAVRAAACNSRPGQNTFLSVPRGELAEQDATCKPSKRELEVLLLAARVLSNRQISAALKVSEATVKRHLANLFPKMKVGSRGEAVRKALCEGWISVEDVIARAEVRRTSAAEADREILIL